MHCALRFVLVFYIYLLRKSKKQKNNTTIENIKAASYFSYSLNNAILLLFCFLDNTTTAIKPNFCYCERYMVKEQSFNTYIHINTKGFVVLILTVSSKYYYYLLLTVQVLNFTYYFTFVFFYTCCLHILLSLSLHQTILSGYYNNTIFTYLCLYWLLF